MYFDGKFPDKCASWSEALGCTRVLLLESSCTRPSDIGIDIPDRYQIVFSEKDFDVDLAIGECVKSIPSSKIVDSKTEKGVVHATVQSLLFGFLDDFYV